MLHSIWSEQICLVADKGRYCRPILEEQVYMGWDGLAKKAGEIRLEAGLPDVRRVDTGHPQEEGEGGRHVLQCGRYS